MANLASVLKEEIRRLAKREIKAETGKTKRAVVQCRRNITQLKRLLAELARKIAALQKSGGTSAEHPAEDAGE